MSVDVSVDLVSSFNKMKSLSTDKNIILQAIKRSSLVEVSYFFGREMEC